MQTPGVSYGSVPKPARFKIKPAPLHVRSGRIDRYVSERTVYELEKASDSATVQRQRGHRCRGNRCQFVFLDTRPHLVVTWASWDGFLAPPATVWSTTR